MEREGFQDPPFSFFEVIDAGRFAWVCANLKQADGAFELSSTG
jgi:hypothetical protein